MSIHTDCQKWCRANGIAYPRTCMACGLTGPCKYDDMTTPSDTRAGKLPDIAFAIMNTAESSDECADKVLVDRSLVGQLREALAASEPVEAVEPFGYLREFDEAFIRNNAPSQAQVIVSQTPQNRKAVAIYTAPPAAVSIDDAMVERACQAFYAERFLRTDHQTTRRFMRAALTAALDLQGSCTCPSGDGSLRWPCPKHPLEAS